MLKRTLRNKIVAFMMAALMMTATMSVNVAARSDASADDYARHAAEIQLLNDALNDHLVANYGYEFAQNYHIAAQLTYDLLESFPRSRAGHIMYPECFGGTYIDAYGNAVFLVTSHMALRRNGNTTELALASRLDEAVVRYVEFSFNDLWDMVQMLNAVFMANPYSYAFQNVDGWFLDVIGNRVVVELDELSRYQIFMFRSLIVDSPMIVFRQDSVTFYQDASKSPSVEHHSVEPFSFTVLPGNMLVQGSLGYRAMLLGTGEIGFVTAAHVVYDRVTVSEGPIVDRSLWGVDAAFVAVRDGVQMSNRVFNVYHSNTFAHPFPGHRTMIRGRHGLFSPRFSEIRRIGQTTSSPADGPFGAVTVFNTVFVYNRNQQFAQQGDSGGIVLSGPQQTPNTVLGIHLGTARVNGVPTYGVVSLASEIERWLGVRVF